MTSLKLLVFALCICINNSEVLAQSYLLNHHFSHSWSRCSLASSDFPPLLISAQCQLDLANQRLAAKDFERAERLLLQSQFQLSWLQATSPCYCYFQQSEHLLQEIHLKRTITSLAKKNYASTVKMANFALQQAHENPLQFASGSDFYRHLSYLYYLKSKAHFSLGHKRSSMDALTSSYNKLSRLFYNFNPSTQDAVNLLSLHVQLSHRYSDQGLTALSHHHQQSAKAVYRWLELKSYDA